MPVIYGGVSIRPAPYVTLTKDNQTLGDGRWVGTTITATLHGSIVATKMDDVETSIDIEQRLSTILQKQATLRNTFKLNGQWLEIQGLDGSQSMKFIADVENIEFQEGPWVDVCSYTITLRGEAPAGEADSQNNHIESASESWQFEEGDGQHTYRVTHTLQAKGKTVYNNATGTVAKLAWEYAKDFITLKLGLDWPTTAPPWSPMSGNDIFTTGNIQPEPNLLPFNRIIAENVDETEGSYSVTETFFLSQNPWWEEYTVTIHKEIIDPRFRNVVSINGVIHGLASGLHMPESRIMNATTWWNTVQTILYSRVSGYVPGITLNPKGTVRNVDQNVTEGTISYQYEFNDRVLINHTTEFYNVVTQNSIEDSKTTVTVDGVIIGEIYPDDIYDIFLRYNRAYTQWNIVKFFIFGRAVSESGVSDLKPFPVAASMTPNKQDGSVAYSFTFDNRIPETVRHEYTVSTHFSREDGRTIISIDGNITGLRFINPETPSSTNNVNERYTNANTYFNSISTNILGLAATYVNITAVNPVPFNSTVNHIPLAGQVTYQYEYNSNPKPCVPGALSENITITDDIATPLIAIIPVLGRALGPIIQDIGTVKEKRRNLTIEIVMPTSYATTNMCSVGGAPTVDITPYAPTGSSVFLEQDQTQWSPSIGHFTRTCSWVYE